MSSTISHALAGRISSSCAGEGDLWRLRLAQAALDEHLNRSALLRSR